MKTIVIFNPLYIKNDLDICKKYTGNDAKVVFIDTEKSEIIEYMVDDKAVYCMFGESSDCIESISSYQITDQIGLIFK
jgi:hypothetical protein